MKPEEPARLVLESSGASAELRRALGAARGDLPSPDQVEAMLARFPFPDGGGGGDTGGGPEVGAGADLAAGAATKSAAIGKWIGIAFLAASAGTVFYAKTTVPPHAVTPTASAVATASATSATTAVSAPQPSASETIALEPSAPTAIPSEKPVPHTQPPPAVSTSEPSASASSGPARSEIEILKDAHASRSNPARMLELVNEHARLYPKGTLGQEREMLRIEALVGLGKRAEAKALADAFRKANPSSAYAERLNQIVPP